MIFQGSGLKYTLSLLCHLLPDSRTQKSSVFFSMADDRGASLRVKDIPDELPGLPLEKEPIF